MSGAWNFDYCNTLVPEHLFAWNNPFAHRRLHRFRRTSANLIQAAANVPYIPHNYNIDIAEIVPPIYGHSSSWNDVLRAASKHHLPPVEEGWLPITAPPPPEFPDFSELNDAAKLDMNFVRELPEFRHWRDQDFGAEVTLNDIDLLNRGKVSLVYLFLRGAVTPLWYAKVQDVVGFHDRQVFSDLFKLRHRRIEQYIQEINRVSSDFEEMERLVRQDQLRKHDSIHQYTPREASTRAASPLSCDVRALDRRHRASPYSSDLKDQTRYAPDISSDHRDAAGPAHVHRTPTSPPPSLASREVLVGKNHARSSELRFGEMPAVHIRRQSGTEAEPSRLPQWPRAATPSTSRAESEWYLQNDEAEARKTSGLDEIHARTAEEKGMRPKRQRMHGQLADADLPTSLFAGRFFDSRPSDIVSLPSTNNGAIQVSQTNRDTDIEQLKSGLEEVERLAVECRTMYEQARGKLEVSGGCGVDAGNGPGGKSKGKEPMRDT